MASSQQQRLDAFLSDPASFLDHTLLKPTATADQIKQLCAEARQYKCKTVCVNTRWIPLCVEELKGAETVPIAVAGFPLGACATEAKVVETKLAIAQGAKEIDMVISLGDLLCPTPDRSTMLSDVQSVVSAASPYPVKVILETCLIPSPELKALACRLCVEAGAQFVKTSTGFSTGGATVEDIALMRKEVGDNVGVKASGGIRTFQDARKMVEAGASRIGASASVAMLKEWEDLKAAGKL